MDQLPIYVISNAMVVGSYVSNVAALVGTDEFRMFLQSVMAIGLIVSVAQAAVTLRYQAMLTFSVSSILLYLTMVNTTTDVEIISKRDGSIAIVEDVPFGVGGLASLITSLGLNLTELFELGFAPVGGGTIGPTGTITAGSDDPFFHIRAVRATARLLARPTQLKAIAEVGAPNGAWENMIGYVSACLMSRAQKEDLSRSWFFTRPLEEVIRPGVVGTLGIRDAIGNSRTCNDLYLHIVRRLPFTFGETPLIPPATWDAAIQSDVERFMGCENCAGDVLENLNLSGGGVGTLTGREYVTAALWRAALEQGFLRSAMEQGEAAHAAAMTTAIEQRAAQWRGEGGIFLQSIATLAGFIEGFALSIGPMMLLVLALGTMGVAMAIRYMWLLVWLQLWFPMLAIVNFMLYALTAFGNPLNGLDLDLTINTIEIYEQFILEVAGTVDYSLTMVTVLATMIVFGASTIVANNVSQRVRGGDFFDESVPARAQIGSSPLTTWGPEAQRDSFGVAQSSGLNNLMNMTLGTSMGNTGTVASTTAQTANSSVGFTLTDNGTVTQSAGAGRDSTNGTFTRNTNAAGQNSQIIGAVVDNVGNNASLNQQYGENDATRLDTGASVNARAGAAAVPDKGGGGGGVVGAVASAAGVAGGPGGALLGRALSFIPGVGADGSVRISGTDGREHSLGAASSTSSAQTATVTESHMGNRQRQSEAGRQAAGGAFAREGTEFSTSQSGTATQNSTFGRGETSESRDAMTASQNFGSKTDMATFASRFAQLPMDRQMELGNAAFAIGAGGEIQGFLARNSQDFTRAMLCNSQRFGIGLMTVLSGLRGHRHPDDNVAAQRQALANEILAETMGHGPHGHGSTAALALRNANVGSLAPSPTNNDIASQAGERMAAARAGRETINPSGPAIDGPMPTHQEAFDAVAPDFRAASAPVLQSAQDAASRRLAELTDNLGGGNVGFMDFLRNGAMPGFVGEMIGNASEVGSRWAGIGAAIAAGRTYEEQIDHMAQAAENRALELGASPGQAAYAAGVVLTRTAENETAANYFTMTDEARAMWAEKGEALKQEGLALEPGLAAHTEAFERALNHTVTSSFNSEGREDVFQIFQGAAGVTEGVGRIEARSGGAADDELTDNRQ